MKILASRNEVQNFISRFLPIFEIWGVIFLDREKNNEALKALGISNMIREEVIKSIEVDDYVQTIIQEASFGDMWVFGKDYKGTELYIKIAMGKPDEKTICISFHKAEYPLQYAYKEDIRNDDGH